MANRKKKLTFLNYDAGHRHTTLQDLKLINTHVNAHVSRQAIVKRLQEKEISSACSCGFGHLQPCALRSKFGGLRTEPFNALPIEYRGYVPEAFDYYTQVYAPLVMKTGNFQGQLQAQTFMSNLLATPMFFEALIAMMLMIRNLSLDKSKRMSSAILFHTNNAVASLRECLLLPDEMYSDVVLMSICAIAMVHRLAGDYAAFDAHVNGARHIVAARGGLQKLGWHGFVKTAVGGMIELWEVLRKQQDQHADKTADETSTKEALVLPSTPTQNSLPPGIQNLISAHRLSTPTIKYLGLVFSWLPGNPHPPPSITKLARQILERPGLNMTSRLLIVAFQAYLTYLGRSEQGWSNTATEHSVRMLPPSLSSAKADYDVDVDVFEWSVLMIGAATDKGSDAQRWAWRMLREMSLSEGRGRELGRLFVPVWLSPMEQLCLDAV